MDRQRLIEVLNRSLKSSISMEEAIDAVETYCRIQGKTDVEISKFISQVIATNLIGNFITEALDGLKVHFNVNVVENNSRERIYLRYF